MPNGRNHEAVLDRLLGAYRDACPAPEPGPNFMPELWQRIEARRTYSFVLGRLAGGFVTAALALAMGMALFLYVPRGQNSPFYSESYVEALSNLHPETAEVLGVSDAALVDEL